MISSVEWIPQGVADPNPKRIEMSPEELEMLEMEAKMEQNLNVTGSDDDDDDDMATKKTTGGDNDNDEKNKLDAHGLPSELNMDDYSSDEGDLGNIILGKENAANDSDMDDNDDDNDDDDESDTNDLQDMMNDDNDRDYAPTDVQGLKDMGLGENDDLNDLRHDPNSDDSDADSEKEDLKLKDTDAVIVVAKTEKDFASLEIMIYEETGNLYCHHDIPLPSFPLCLAHGDIGPEGRAGNFCAVGTFSPEIEIWNMDLLDVLTPVITLGGAAEDDYLASNIQKAKSQKSIPSTATSTLKPGSHTDAVMALSWNKTHRQVLASSSADATVKLWDVTSSSPSPASSFSNVHRDKISCVAWHPKEGTVLATGSYDRTVALVDARSARGDKRTVSLTADVEGVVWDPWEDNLVSAASEDGRVVCWDVRFLKKSVWDFVACEFGGVSDLAYSGHVPGLLATCAIDKTVSLYDTQNVSSLPEQRPQLCVSKDMQSGKLYTVSFYPSRPWLLGCGGSGNNLCLWNMEIEDAVQKQFGPRVSSPSTTTTTEMGTQEASSETGTKQEEFEAMMSSAKDDIEKKDSATATKNKKKKKKKDKGKRNKVHRRERFE
eukprot:CAMPEP_0172489582 /NCGR_PEP_ID=MMETSP1066-20121228/19674_1 /TAXON_ID=671091 /ORGANISM="Coscinodiscus wailesii, Strain CCMP2513" /LENGTH=602 /DNA_ID=CAMNT_0013257547 /DNA_START=229 /DNA_END=2037 /DNA_ORIENTATION=+